MRRIALALTGTLLLAAAPAGGRTEAAPAPRTESAAADVAPARDVAQAQDTALVVLTEWRIDISPAQLRAGRNIIRVVNRGRERHAVELEKGEHEVPGDLVAPGEESILTVDLDPGTWSISCPRASPSAHGGHGRRGMRRTFVVR